MGKIITINPPQIMGKSPRIIKIFEQIGKIASKDVPVLISGENGTYKELVARVIHDNSPRKRGPFIAMNLMSVPEELAEMELLGSQTKTAMEVREQKSGKIIEADGGTLFIEEIFRVDVNLGGKLTLLIQDKKIRLNNHDGIQSDVRIIGTTSRNLGELVKKGQSLYDLYKAFHGVHLRIPSLRERKEDILPLVRYIMDESAKKFDTAQKKLSQEAIDYLMKYEWPGNVRELENMIKRATILSQGPLLEKKDLLMADIGSCSIKEFLEEKLKRYLEEMMKLETCNLFETVLSEVERSLIDIVLRETRGNQLKAAKTLGITRNTLRSKIRGYKIRI
jgi:two-component system, NtrC family, nitrogen regulation response regulator GlnG